MDKPRPLTTESVVTGERVEPETMAARFMFRAVDAMMAAREQWIVAGRRDLYDELEPHYQAICEMGRREVSS